MISRKIVSTTIASIKLKDSIEFHLTNTMGLGLKGVTLKTATRQQIYTALSLSLRDKIMKNWAATNATYRDNDVKQAFYFSQEFLMGRSLGNNLINIGASGDVERVLNQLGFSANDIEDAEMEAGLGNGGLGRLAACFLDSLASLKLPGHGHGLYYQHGIFAQEIKGGWQVEKPDSWLQYGNPWAIKDESAAVDVKFGGNLVAKKNGRETYTVDNYEAVHMVPFRNPVTGYGVNNVNTLTLWEASPDYKGFNFGAFNSGDYQEALTGFSAKTKSITSVLYPNDNMYEGKVLRLKQEFSMVSAGLQDIIRNYKETHNNFDQFAKKVALQINDTHPSLIVPELMRLLMYENGLGWNEAWAITRESVAYTNHTVLPEALEKWSQGMMRDLLPVQYKIIEIINMNFCDEIRQKYGNLSYEEREKKVQAMSILEDGLVKMANLAIVGSHSVNGVAELHTEIIKESILHDFYEMYPEKFNNKTNGITPRRWMVKANPELTKLISSQIGEDWIKDLSQLEKLKDLADDKAFLRRLINIKKQNKEALAEYIYENNPVKDDQGNIIDRIEVNPESIFDVQSKRLHEYKRQLMNALNILMMYNDIKANPDKVIAPRTFIFGAKAAPGYHTAKNIIKFINMLARDINNDPSVKGLIKVVYLENYNVSLAEKLIPAADLSEQISTAGLEASGTGNMKFMANGALTIGTLDGANVEMAEEAGKENMFIFGLTKEEVNESRGEGKYSPWDMYNSNDEIRQVIDQLDRGAFARNDSERDVLGNLKSILMDGGDYYRVLADIPSYREAQQQVSDLYMDEYEWAKKALLNIASSGKFSSDRTITDYNNEIWHLEETDVDSPE